MKESEGAWEMDSERYRILVVEDDSDIRELLALYLESGGFEVSMAERGDEVIFRLEKEQIDLILLDIMLPGMSGYDVIRQVREKYNIPIIILSARVTDNDRILGLDLGADGYLTKPFNPLEVVANVKAQLRRYFRLKGDDVRQDGTAAAEGEIITRDEMVLDTYAHSFRIGGREVPLTSSEYRALCLLMKNPGRIFTKSQIYREISGEECSDYDNAVMVHISNLRKKIEDDQTRPKYIETVRGLGYRFAEDNKS